MSLVRQVTKSAALLTILAASVWGLGCSQANMASGRGKDDSNKATSGKPANDAGSTIAPGGGVETK